MKRVEESKGEGRRVEESAGVLEKERAGKRAGERRGLPERGIGKGMSGGLESGGKESRWEECGGVRA